MTDDAIEIANEFATVTVRRVATRNGTRLRIAAIRTGRSVDLCPLELEGITWQSPEGLSRLLRDPFGSDGTPAGTDAR